MRKLGANSGIGKGIALAMAHAGADVVVNYRSNPEAAEEVVREGFHCGTRVYAHQADVSDEAQVQAMFSRMFEEYGTIDILVNNAGVQQDAPFEQMTLPQWNTVLGVNLTGQFLCAGASRCTSQRLDPRVHYAHPRRDCHLNLPLLSE
jgi:glucose 1-dehydrogenase